MEMIILCIFKCCLVGKCPNIYVKQPAKISWKSLVWQRHWHELSVALKMWLIMKNLLNYHTVENVLILNNSFVRL